MNPPSSNVSPGLLGFLAFFFLAVALYLLMRNMNARMRRMSYRSQELARQAEEEEAARRAAKDQRKAARREGAEPPSGGDPAVRDAEGDSLRGEPSSHDQPGDGPQDRSGQDAEPAP